jgi:hypothetical protein
MIPGQADRQSLYPTCEAALAGRNPSSSSIDDGRLWPYQRCRELYQGNAYTGDKRRLNLVVNTSSIAVEPACLLREELAEYFTHRSTAAMVPPFRSAALAYVEPVDHTMAYALPRYCLNKVREAPRQTISQGERKN